MSSRIGFVSCSVGPIKGYKLDLNYQNMTSGTKISQSVLDPALSGDQLAGFYQDSTIGMQSIGAILRKKISGDRTLFTEYQTSDVTGFLGNKKSVLAFGIEYPLNEILGLTVDWRVIDYKGARSAANNYRASMLNAKIGARFR